MSSSNDPPDMRVNIGTRLTLPTPVVAASGGFGFGTEVADLADTAALGALITPTLTVSPRAGHPMPRTAETSAGLLHSLGWPNPGLKRFLTDRLPRLCELPCQVIISIHGDSIEEWETLGAAFNVPGPRGLELNLSGLSLSGEAAILRRIGDTVEAVRRVSDLPLIAKLPAANVEIGVAARSAAEAGADAIAVSQGFPGAAVRLSARSFRLPGIYGEVSGPCIKPLALYQLWRAAQSVDIPILASGGIMTGEDALEFIVAGAAAVAVGIASSIHPDAIARITAEMRDYLARHGIGSIGALTGAANRDRE